ncbi:glucose-6-phosphate isomerase [Limimonas halophila]|uniref:Glucose-6-phosphate isomerase n=1 Tax=Limimonas halophila TaxID=1082479 RepID=A0A1G7P7I2_9PROT|nr:glucose-6-phosphate isomerase [Limimonas halophila]SDF82262.1 glucose-6-phosphate isomerase [Limimonas halophila]
MTTGARQRAWAALADHWQDLQATRIDEMFTADPRRFQGWSVALDDMLLDISKTKLDGRALDLLADLARAAGVPQRLEAMFAGETVNATENRAALHPVLRAPDQAPRHVDGRDVKAAVAAEDARVRAFAEGVRDGTIAGRDGEPITDVINIGIGGSHLGPALAVRSLRPYRDGPRVHFVANADGADVSDTLRGRDPRRTLIIVSSKSFTTTETLANARTAWAWSARALGEEGVAGHFAAVTAATDKAAAFGIPAERVFRMWDWVGGRYSVWGAVGLPAMIALGTDAFDAFRAGAAAMDAHVREAPLTRNMPVLLALVGVWHANVCGYPTRAVLPYDHRLNRLPGYLQQLDMESNGKAVSADGAALTGHSGPIVWGEVGTNAQHAFFQLLHQGTRIVPCEFLVAADGHEPDARDHHDLLVANCFAQARALMRGRCRAETETLLRQQGMDAHTAARLAPHRSFAGDRPSTMLLYRRLDPFTLGRIIALYEHRVVIEGTIWGVNPFDQWGVELGKELATSLHGRVAAREGAPDADPSTDGLLGWRARLADGEGA